MCRHKIETLDLVSSAVWTKFSGADWVFTVLEAKRHRFDVKSWLTETEHTHTCVCVGWCDSLTSRCAPPRCSRRSSPAPGRRRRGPRWGRRPARRESDTKNTHTWHRDIPSDCQAAFRANLRAVAETQVRPIHFQRRQSIHLRWKNFTRYGVLLY